MTSNIISKVELHPQRKHDEQNTVKEFICLNKHLYDSLVQRCVEQIDKQVEGRTVLCLHTAATAQRKTD